MKAFFTHLLIIIFSKASASGRRLISWLFLKAGFEEIKGPQNVMERELNCGKKIFFGGMKIKICLGSVTVDEVCSEFFFFSSRKIKALARTQMFNLYCIKLAFSLKDYHLKFLSSSIDKHMKDMFHLRLYAEPLWDTLQGNMKTQIWFPYLLKCDFLTCTSDISSSDFFLLI